MHPDQLPSTTDVVIAGAGPTGLALGCVLAANRVPFVLLDRQAEGANTSRAAVIHARTLEVLETLQVTDRLCAEGRVVPRFIVRDRNRVLATLRFDGLPTPYPFTLMLPQYRTEAILLDRLRELGGDVCRPASVQDVRQDATGAVVTVGDGGAGAQIIRARYVVGADGMHSTVRECSGIPFVGDAYAQAFVLADVRMEWALPDDEVMLFLSPDGLVIVAPLPDGAHRLVATQDDAPEHPTQADIQALLDARGPTAPAPRVREVRWSSRFRVHHRLAESYRAGRLFLAGDAAHVHSPAGGQGMNTGIQDGVALGRVLAAAIASGDDSGLEDYQRVRRPVAQRVVALTDRMTRVATLRTARSRRARNFAIRTVGHLPAVGRRLATEIAGLHTR